MKPKPYLEKTIPAWDSGVLVVGDEGMLLADYGKHVLLPEARFRGFQGPPKFLPRVRGHHEEWLEACRTGKPTASNFDYGGALTEANHLGNVAYRLGKKIEWDAATMRAKNAPEADRYIRKTYRQGWSLPK